MNLWLLIDLGGFGSAALTGGAVLFLITATFAFIVFRLLKRTVRLAVRMAVVTALLALALIGGIFFLYGTGPSKPERPQRPATTRPAK